MDGIVFYGIGKRECFGDCYRVEKYGRDGICCIRGFKLGWFVLYFWVRVVWRDEIKWK